MDNHTIFFSHHIKMKYPDWLQMMQNAYSEKRFPETFNMEIDLLHQEVIHRNIFTPENKDIDFRSEWLKYFPPLICRQNAMIYYKE